MEQQSKGFRTIFVNVGFPTSNIPTSTKTMLNVNLDEQTEIQAAKLLRKDISEHPWDWGWNKATRFTPSQLYYEIYDKNDSEIPFAMSFNAPYRRDHVNGIIL